MKLSPKHKWAGKAIQDLKIPEGVIIVAAQRAGQVKTATGDLVLAAGDRVVVYCLPDAVAKMEPLFAS